MWFTFPLMIRGWFTDIRSWRGRGGIRILEFGLAARISRSELALESVGGAVLDGAGVIGDSIGITITRSITTAGTTPEAERFITEAAYYRGGGERGGRKECARGERAAVSHRAGGTPGHSKGNRQAARGYAEPRGQSGVHSGAFSGYDHGGETRSFSSRGRASFGGGGFHGGGGHVRRWRRRRWRSSVIGVSLCFL